MIYFANLPGPWSPRKAHSFCSNPFLLKGWQSKHRQQKSALCNLMLFLLLSDSSHRWAPVIWGEYEEGSSLPAITFSMTRVKTHGFFFFMIGRIHRKIFCDTEYGTNQFRNTLVQLLSSNFLDISVYFMFSWADHANRSFNSIPLSASCQIYMDCMKGVLFCSIYMIVTMYS